MGKKWNRYLPLKSFFLFPLFFFFMRLFIDFFIANEIT